MLHRYIFGKPVVGKLTVNMTVNGVGYYRHEMGHPVIKTMEVSSFIPWSTHILILRVNAPAYEFRSKFMAGIEIRLLIVLSELLVGAEFYHPSKYYYYHTYIVHDYYYG